MIEPELSFCDNIDNMDCAESYIKFCLRFLLENNKDDLEFLQRFNQAEHDALEKELSKGKGGKKKASTLPYTPLVEYI